jgi:hypothetical protein
LENSPTPVSKIEIPKSSESMMLFPQQKNAMIESKRGN